MISLNQMHSIEFGLTKFFISTSGELGGKNIHFTVLIRRYG
jgi:hypothetical protein